MYARNPKTESCHDTDPAVTGGTGGCRLSPAVSPAPTKPAPCELSVLVNGWHGGDTDTRG